MEKGVDSRLSRHGTHVALAKKAAGWSDFAHVCFLLPVLSSATLVIWCCVVLFSPLVVRAGINVNNEPRLDYGSRIIRHALGARFVTCHKDSRKVLTAYFYIHTPTVALSFRFYFHASLPLSWRRLATPLIQVCIGVPNVFEFSLKLLLLLVLCCVFGGAVVLHA